MVPYDRTHEGEQRPDKLDARLRDLLMRYFLRRVGRDKASAEDLTQEVLLRTVNASRTRHIDHLPAFVFRVALNLLRDRRRAVMRSGEPVFVPIDTALASELESQLVEDFSPERVLSSRQTLDEALQTLEELGGLTRDIFILFRLENMKQKDIAALYGIGQSTVEKHVMKAVAFLASRHGRR
jgi:RNA polymerase sigma factor (sigma-70 family)